MKKKCSRFARPVARVALALACTLAVSHVGAVPYASQIRFGETQLVQTLGTELLYTLNEDCDEVTVEVYNSTTATVVRTFDFASPAPETQRGRHTIVWDGRDESNNLLPLNGGELVLRVNVKKLDASTEWTLITNNSSTDVGKATEQKSIFGGFSSNDIEIPVDPTSDHFGLLFVSHAYGPASPAGLVLFGTDLAPVIGNGGGVDAVKGQHITSPSGSQSVWKTNFDPLDPNLMWWTGQTTPQKIGVFSTAGILPTDIQAVADNVWESTISPRGIAIALDNLNNRVGYSAHTNQIDRLTLDQTYPFAVQANEIITEATIGGAVRYAQDIAVDANGNLYFLSRLGDNVNTQGTLWRWDKAVVEAAPGTLLNADNAAWHVTIPVGTTHLNAMAVDPVSGNVYVGANNGSPRGIFLVGNVADANLPAKPYQLSVANQILDYDNTTQFPVGFSASTLGHGVAADWKGNLYVTTRTLEEIHSFSPPGNGVEHDITTSSPAGYFATIAFSQSNLAFVDATNPTPDGISTFNSLRAALLSFGPGGNNNGFAGTNRIEVQTFGPFNEELPDLTPAFDADDFQIVGVNGPFQVLQRTSPWELGSSVEVSNMVLAASSTNTPTGTLVSSTGSTQTFTNSWITALPAAASSYSSLADIPSGIADGTAPHDPSLVRAGAGLTITGGSVALGNTIVSQHTGGVIFSGSSLNLTDSQVVANSGDGISASTGAVALAGGSQVSNNGGSGIFATGTSDLSLDSAYLNPNQILGNAVAGIAISSSTAYEIRNTLIHGSSVGLDLQSGAFSTNFGDYLVTDVIIAESATAGIRVANNIGFSAARLTLFDNTVGFLDLQTRTGFWTAEFQDTIIAGAGDTGIASPGAENDSIRLDHSAIVTAGPHAVATPSTAPGAALFVDGVLLNADPIFRRTEYSRNRIRPDFYLAPSSQTYLNAAAPPGSHQGDGSFNGNLGGGSRWRVPGIVPSDTVYESNFETDQTANFTVSEFIGGDSSIDFNYDYSTFAQAGGGFPQSIPASPFNTGTGKRGVRMATNLVGGALNGITATLNSIPPQTNMRITIDAWQNFGTTASTETISFGASADATRVAMSGGNYFTSPNEPFAGFFFSASHEGGQGQDYRYYDGDGINGAIGDNATRANFLDIGAVDNSAFTSVFPAPPYAIAGTPGKQWNRWEIDIYWGHIRLFVTRSDGQRFLMCDWFVPNDGTVMDNLRPHFGNQDLFVSLAVPTSDQFVLIDYMRVQLVEQGDEVVEPPVILGDLNGDGIINVADVTELANAIAANSLPPAAVGDINGDTFVNSADVAALAALIVNP